MGKKYSYSEVYVQSGFPEHTYAVRENLDFNFSSSLEDKGTHIYMCGTSKSGKSSMWKKYLNDEEVIKIFVTQDTTIEQMYNEILEHLKAFYVTEIHEEDNSSDLVNGAIGSNLAIMKADVTGEKTTEEKHITIQKRISTPSADLHTVINYLSKSTKKIIIEEFHLASPQFLADLMNCLKTLADNEIKVVIVGLNDRTYEMFNTRRDLSSRISILDISTFEDEELKNIIELGAEKLNIVISEEVQNFLISEANHRAYILQNLCRNLCKIENITETQVVKRKITNIENAKLACIRLARLHDAEYKNTVKVLAKAGSMANQSDSYRLVLRVLKNLRIGDEGIAIKEIVAKIKGMGYVINDGSINACVPRLPKKLEQNGNVIQVFKYKNKVLYITDDFFQFYLRWSEELLTELGVQ